MFGRRGWKGVNERARLKLQNVAEFLSDEVDDFDSAKVVSPLMELAIEAGLLLRLGVPDKCEEIKELYIGYVPKNKALATIYDFMVWAASDNYESNTVVKNPVKILSNKNELIDTRRESLNVFSSRAYCFDGEMWLEFSCMVGSCTWNAIPPMLQVVKFTDKDKYQLFELIRMVIITLENLSGLSD